MSLPSVGDVSETLHQDCKRTYDLRDPKTRSEIAKDVAAFANAHGGRILVGVDEAEGLVSAIPGLPPADAAACKVAVEQVVRDKLRPAPAISVTLVPHSNGNVVVIVGVLPFPGQVVGLLNEVRTRESWTFPVRIGTNTAYYSPEQMSLLMDPTYRRKTQLLSQCVGKRIRIANATTVSVRSLGGGRTMYHGDIVEIDEMGNSICVKSAFGEGKTWISIDVVQRVWREGEEWHIRIDGYLYGAPDGTTLGYSDPVQGRTQ